MNDRRGAAGRPRPAATDRTPDEAENILLLERCRIGVLIVMVGIAVVFVGEIALRRGQRPWISVLQGVNFTSLLVLCVLARDPARRTYNTLLCFTGFVITAICIGAVGIVAGDATSSLVVLVGLAMGAAVLVPWGARYQLPGIAATTLVAIWTLSAIRPGAREYWLQPVGSVFPTFCASVIVAYLVRRQRQSLCYAEWERRGRERALHEFNRRLETEIHDHENTEKALRFAVLELDHRVKNTLASLQSIAEQTLDTSASPEEFAESFRGRIRAMAKIHSALAARRWEAIELDELIELVVGPHRAHEDSISTSCSRAWVSSAEARALGTALHELATNASKYGSLSTREGRVTIECQVSSGPDSRLHLVWSERGGPKVTDPQRRGLGTKLIEQALAYESGGRVRLDFDEEGVCCDIEMPLAAPERKGE